MYRNKGLQVKEEQIKSKYEKKDPLSNKTTEKPHD